MIIAGILAFICGTGQFALLGLAINAVMHKKITKGIILALVKVAVYIGVFFSMVKFFGDFLIPFLIGFGIGFFICLAVYAVKTIRNL